jgi:SRSO17 transposase
MSLARRRQASTPPGVRRQYLGCAGRVANGINAVYASYAAPAGNAVIAARLYVPTGPMNQEDVVIATGNF